MEKNIFSPDQERQILRALDEIDADIGIDKLNDERDLSRLFTKLSDYGQAKSQSNERTTHLELTRRSLGVYLGSAFTGGLAFAGALVALIPTLMAPSIIATRSVLVDSERLLDRTSLTYQLPENLETEYMLRISSEDPNNLLLEVTEAATRAGVSVFILGGDERKLRLNLYGIKQDELSHIPVWALLGISPTDYRSISIEIVN